MTLLHLDKVGRRYGGLHALHDLTLDLAAGERRAVIGANGAGKSTLLHLIAGSVRPTSGRILFDGRDITQHTPATRARRGIGRTFQHPAVFSALTAAENIALAITRHTPRGDRRRRILGHVLTEHVQAALQAIGLDAYTDAAAGSLSYGIRRQLEFAVALAAHPRLLLLDEPSAGLDPEETDRLAATIRGLPAEMTVLLIDHHLDLVWAVADSVTVLHHGQHVATAAPADVIANPAVQAAYLATSAHRPRRNTQPAATQRPTLLRVQDLRTGHHGAAVLHMVSFDLADGEVLAVLGRNGSGKSTLLNTVAGLHPHPTAGVVEYAGAPLPSHPQRVARSGVALVPQGRRLFDLTVAEHLTAAVAARNAVRARSTDLPGDADGITRENGRCWTLADVLDLFPPLRNRLRHRAARLSGGEQQMLALARALLSRPRLLLLDEPAEGLAPTIIDQLTATIRRVSSEGITVLVAEQNIELAFAVADRVMVLERGQVAFGPARLTTAAQRRQVDDLLGVTPTWRAAGSIDRPDPP